ncbi:serine hydrolase [Candidatus Saccharibacteria bacterium]|nr:serine hydrolase [Candidatus Saccharibacteria bacterium]
MVSKSTHKSKAIKHQHKRFWLLLLLFFVVAGVSIAICYLVKIFLIDNPANTPEDAVTESDVSTITDNEAVINPIDFQPDIEEFVSSIKGKSSVLIYDLDRDEFVGSYNETETYNTASLYKLFVVYEGYKRINAGEWDPTEKAGTTGFTVLECLDLAIRQSHSPCAETLWGKIGRPELDQIVSDYGFSNTSVSNLTSNPEDIFRIMQFFYLHPDFEREDLVLQMKNSFLNQPATEYDWRQGLPSGFSIAKVYNKVGWDYNPNGRYWNIYHDAAIIEFPEDNRHFIVVVMTNRVPFDKITELGNKIEQTYLNQR